jgi:hypothetical protein
LWVLKHKIKNEAGIPIDFSKRKYLWDIYNDLSPKQALLKPPQIGATVMSMLKVMWVAKKLRKDIIYTLPTDTDVRDIVGGSINRIIVQNPVLREWVKDHDTVEQKGVGGNLIRFRGAFNPKQATMVPSSLNVHDEVDNSDPTILTLYETRQEAQEKEENKWRWYFSHPSLAGEGVDIQWQKSDMKEWYITCNECDAEQVLTWPESIKDGQYVCKHCGSVLSDNERINGRWKNKDGVVWTGKIVGPYQFSGWHVSQLMLFNKSAQAIVDAFNDPQKDQQYFYNYVLGLPYISADDRIDPSTVLRNSVDRINPRTSRTVIGCDTGHGLHYVLMNKDGVFYYDNEKEITATKDPYDAIRRLLREFPKSIAVFDQGGDLIGVRKLVQEYPGRIFLCFYNKDRKTAEFVEWNDDHDTEWWKVRVDRNRMMTLIVEQMREIGRITLNGTKDEWAEFASHFGYIYREKLLVKETRGKDNRELYGAEYVWKRKGPDHYVHALLYAIVGMQRFGQGEAKVVGDNVLAGIPQGQIAQPATEEPVVAGYGADAFASENRVTI